MRAGTLNIWHDAGPWPRRLPLIRREIERRRPDVLGLQEVLRTPGDTPASAGTCQALAIAAGTDYHVAYAPAAPRHGGPAWQGNAVLSRWPIREHRAVTLPGADVAEPRSLLYALIETPDGDLPVFVTHLAWEPHHGPLRQRQTAFIASQADALAPAAALLLGDFNAEPGAAEMKILADAGFTDAWPADVPGYTFDRANDYARDADEPSCRIDYVLVRGMAAAGARLAFTEPDPAGVWPSDHFGVLAEVTPTP